MGIIDIVRNFKNKKSEKSEKFKQLEEDFRLQKTLEERQKSSNQRAIEKFYKDEQEKEFKKELDKIRKKQTKESWKGDSILKGGTSILEDNGKSLAGGKSILKQKNIFLDHKANMPITKKALFFKW